MSRAPMLIFAFALLTLVGVAASGPVIAASKVLKNDSYPQDAATCTSVAQPGDEIAARFDTVGADVPYKIEAIEILVCGGGTGTVGWDIFQETGAVVPILIRSSGAKGYPIQGNGALNVIDVSLQNIMVNSNAIRVGLFYSGGKGGGFGVDAANQPMRNFTYRSSNGKNAWRTLESHGVNGDWIMRLQITTPNQTSTPTQTRTPTVPVSVTTTPTRTPTPPTGGNRLDGHVSTQRVLFPAVDLKVEFFPAQAGPNPGQTPLAVYTATTLDNGTFSINNVLAGGPYDIRVTHNQAIPNEKENVTMPASGPQFVEFGLLRTGDADQNRSVTPNDFSVLKNTFNLPTNCAIQNPIPLNCADFDANQTVSSNDFSLFKGNFNLSSPQFV
jgi:hypothetical protein